ncbi:TetR/AcrR family transcriptional regulator [Stackebrandtia nassauensis]|uniref:Transcriptional regulator, TetR family n=1 Tax=Stackebrandtia nassauensis (strain DSM 44728 / CIP 108903 / NRRL B-16338 / NBRC 102104 / LLR-40K-21) TaxID=446470 RepID=D3PY19_STANL|nr:TetR/AcrR family transcriptional regulator [Stackebrandtia nassauensis]ADD45348.1 transcriptional regulator, TetR family [Stackebrandtia nassauensis DSM 44728]
MSSSQQKSSYHHGNLRQELLDASLRLIAEEGVGAVSLRRVAREAGVSPGAPYHHFADRAALLAALSTTGFNKLAERLCAAREGSDEPQDALLAMLDAYVEFAAGNRAHFQLMFRPELSLPDKHPDVHAAGDAAFKELTEPLEAWQREGLLPAADLTGLVMTLWALGHGIASLWIDGHLEKRCTEMNSTPDELLRQVRATVADLIGRWSPPSG